MRLVVDMTKCQSYAQCCFLAPDTFAFQGREALVYDPAPSDADRARIVQAAAACPVQAILLDRTPVDVIDRPEQDPRAAHLTSATGHRRTTTSAPLHADGRIVIVGASLAGLRAAETIRREGFTGRLTVIGDEQEQPYDRPPLSKQVLAGLVPPENTALPHRENVNAEWKLGVAATGLDLAGKQVLLADGEKVGFDRLLIATGTRARPWPVPSGAGLDGVFTLRTVDDARRLHTRLAGRPGRVLIIGGGFTGSEVASVCRDLGLPVTHAVRGPAPLAGALGGVIGRVAADAARAHGVDLRLATSVTALEGDRDGTLRRARLSDGSVVDADVAVVAIGAVRNVEWLAGAGLSSGSRGVTCDAGCRVFDANGVITDDVFVAGDVAQFPNPLLDSPFLTVEHWGNAVEQAEVAAHNMVTGRAQPWTHHSVPVFWSIQFGHVIKSVGLPTGADEVMITQGSVEERSFVAVYGRAGRIVAAVAFDQSKWLEHYRRLIAEAAPFPPDAATVDAVADPQPVPAEMPPEPVIRPDDEAADLVTTAVQQP